MSGGDDLRPLLRAVVRARAENRPGVYRMLDAEGRVIYVGKSVRVRTRLLSYFRARGEKAAGIIGEAAAVDWSYAPDEFACVLEEMRLIRRWRPRHNVEHKREPGYWFLKLTREPAPRLLHAATVAEDGAAYLGPFRGRSRLRLAVRELSDVLQLRDCAAATPMRFADQTDLFGGVGAPLCYRGEIGRCLSPCAARCTRSEYRARVVVAEGFLRGDAARPLELLRERMHAAGERLQFELAAELRDRIGRLERVRDELAGLGRALENLTFIYPVRGHAGEDHLYLLRRGRVRGELAVPVDAAGRAAARRLIEQVYGTPEREAGVPPRHAAEVLLVARWFRLRPAERLAGLTPERMLRALGGRPVRRRSAAAPAVPAPAGH
jgi:excinuclease ABC subunit C